MTFSYDNRIVLVTGRSVGALGSAVRDAFVEAHASVNVSYIVPQEVALLKNRLGKDQSMVNLIESDLMKEESVKHLVDAVIRSAGRLV